MTDQEKVCSLMIYEMSLKEGLAYNEKQDKDIVEGLVRRSWFSWKNSDCSYFCLSVHDLWHSIQLETTYICYYFVRDGTKLHSFTLVVKECISRVVIIGLCIKAVVCDQGANNQQLIF